MCIYYSVCFLSTEREFRTASTFLVVGIQNGYGTNPYQNGDRLVYLDARINPGGYYNNITGEYTCKTTGVYYFSYSIHGIDLMNGRCVSASLMKQGIRQGQVFFTNSNTWDIHVSQSLSLVLQCDAGEKVWVQSGHNNNHVFGDYDVDVFAGFLLFMN